MATETTTLPAPVAAEAPAVENNKPAEAVPTAANGAVSKDVLNLGHGVSLTLKDDTLVVKDKAAAKNASRQGVCGIPTSSPGSELPIPLFNVLWAEISNSTLTIDHASPISNKLIRPEKLSYTLPDDLGASAPEWVELLLTRAYGQSQQRKRAKVLVNPHAGPGGAVKIWENQVKPLFDAARMQLDIVTTTYSGEAIDICEKLDLDNYDIIIPCSGDGLPYEVFNGLGKRPDARTALQKVAVAHIPCGSGNAMSCNLYGTHRPSLAALAVVKGVRTPIDLVSITQGDKRLLSFLSQSYGIIAESDLGTEHLRWMGAKRFDVGVVQRILSKKVYPCDLSVKVEVEHKDQIKAHFKREKSTGDFTKRREDSTATQTEGASSEGLPPLKYGSVNDKLPDDWETISHQKMGNFYAGNMAYMAPGLSFFDAACANDGLMDLVFNDGDLPAMKYVDVMTSVEGGKFFDHPLVSYRKVVAYRLTPRDQKDGYISIDGERIAFEPFQAEVHQGLGTVLSKSGGYEAPGPAGWDKVTVGERIMA